jgi:hypothetical protein
MKSPSSGITSSILAARKAVAKSRVGAMSTETDFAQGERRVSHDATKSTGKGKEKSAARMRAHCFRIENYERILAGWI